MYMRIQGDPKIQSDNASLYNEGCPTGGLCEQMPCVRGAFMSIRTGCDPSSVSPTSEDHSPSAVLYPSTTTPAL